MPMDTFKTLHRRAVLRGLALGASATFLPSLRRATAAPPKRILIITSTHQQVPEHWRMMGLGGEAKKEWSASLTGVPDASFSPVLRPFAAHKDKLLVVDGLSQLSGIGRSSVNNHDAAGANLLTGAGVNESNEKELLGASVDQVIAGEIEEPGRLRSVELGTYTYAGGFVGSGPGKHLSVIKSLTAAFSTMFGNVTPRPAPGGMPTERELVRNARKDAVAAAKAQLEVARPKLSKTDRERLGAHLELMHKYESLLSAEGQAACSMLPTVKAGLSGNNETFFAEMGRLVAHAFACDAVRVATIQMGDYQPDSFGGEGSVHDTMAHNNGSASGLASLRKYNLAVSRAVGRIVDELANLQLLDSTIVVWMSEHGLFNEPHRLEEMPVVMVGNVGGHFKTGRYVSVPRATRSPRGTVVGTPHNHFLVSLMQAMGSSKRSINIESWLGVPLVGPLPGLT